MTPAGTKGEKVRGQGRVQAAGYERVKNPLELGYDVLLEVIWTFTEIQDVGKSRKEHSSWKKKHVILIRNVASVHVHYSGFA